MTNLLTAISNAQSQDQLIAAGEIIELRFKEDRRALSLRSAKLLHVLANHAGKDAVNDIDHKVAISRINFSHLEIDEFVSCISELMTILVELTYIDEKTNKIRTESGPLLSFVDRPVKFDDGMNYIYFRFSRTVQRILKNSEKWAILSKKIIISFESRYALRLYEMISLRVNLKHKSSETFEIDDLKKRLGVEKKKLKEFSHFRQTALEPAISEVNRLSGFNVSYETLKTGRSTSHITLHWSPKSMTEREKIATELAELPLHKSDVPPAASTRSPEPQGNPKRPVAAIPFPQNTNLSYGESAAHWRELARTHVRRLPDGHIPDLAKLGDTFRNWCAGRGIPLDLETIEKTFITFCKAYIPLDAPND